MKQLSFQKVNGWGGKRRGAGRPNHSSTINHMKRPKWDGRQPGHITLRLMPGLPSLRRKELLKSFAVAAREARKFGLRVVHFSLLGNHFHMIVEAGNARELARGMRSLAGRFGKAIRRLAAAQGLAKAGRVFRGRYHLHILKTPREMKNALEYVLLNRAKHGEFVENLDPYSSAREFTDWKALIRSRFRGLLVEELNYRVESFDLGLSPPRTWLARGGWKRASDFTNPSSV